MTNELQTEVTIQGAAKLGEEFSELHEKLQRKHLRTGMTKGARLTAKAAKSNLKKHRRSGALAASIGQKVKTTKEKTAIYSVVGARRNFDRAVLGKTKRGSLKLGKRGETDGAKRVLRPTRYAHLVADKKWLIAAQKDTQASVRDEMIVALRTGLDKEAAKMRDAVAAATTTGGT